MAGGRPTKYKKDYCLMLINHMREGLSYEAFGGVVGASKQTLYDWEKRHPEFIDAKRVGETQSLLYWEKVGRDGLYHEVIKDADGCTVNRSINATIWIFNMKNRFKWRDKSEDECRDEAMARPLRELTDAELEKMRGNE
jgi:transposase